MMIYGNLARLGANYEYPKVVYDILNYLKEQDFSTWELGTRTWVDERVSINYMEIPYANIQDALCEIHRKYLDIQVSVDGHEIFGFSPDTHNNSIVENRLDTDDICLFLSMEHEVFIEAKPLDFFVFFPNDVHHGCNMDTTLPAKRIVVKVPIAVLNEE